MGSQKRRPFFTFLPRIHRKTVTEIEDVNGISPLFALEIFRRHDLPRILPLINSRTVCHKKMNACHNRHESWPQFFCSVPVVCLNPSLPWQMIMMAAFFTRKHGEHRNMCRVLLLTMNSPASSIRDANAPIPLLFFKYKTVYCFSFPYVCPEPVLVK